MKHIAFSIDDCRFMIEKESKTGLCCEVIYLKHYSASLSKNCYKKQENNLLLTTRSPSPSGRGLGVRVGEAIRSVNLKACFTSLCMALILLFCLTARNVAADTSENPEKQPDLEYRDPFWPVGFSPMDPEDEESSVEEDAVVDQALLMDELWQEALSKISIKGTFKVREKNGKTSYAAMINNTIVKEGQILRIRVKDTTFRIRVRSIDMEHGVKLERIKQ